MLYFEFCKLELNTCLETKVFIVCDCIENKVVYYILVDYVIVNCLKVKSVSKDGFKIGSFIGLRWDVKVNI